MQKVINNNPILKLLLHSFASYGQIMETPDHNIICFYEWHMQANQRKSRAFCAVSINEQNILCVHHAPNIKSEDVAKALMDAAAALLARLDVMAQQKKEPKPEPQEPEHPTKSKKRTSKKASTNASENSPTKNKLGKHVN